MLLSGDLGVGKTEFARGYIHSARADSSIIVTSPTYLLVNAYPPFEKQAGLGLPEIFHMDLWRIRDVSERPILDFESAFTKGACLIEWPDRLKRLIPLNRLEVNITYVGGGVEQVQRPTKKDDWGFKDDDSHAESILNGRYAFLAAYGRKWEDRLSTLLETR